MDLGTIGKKFRKIGRDTVAEVQKMNDIRQINSKINEQKKQISTIYSQIGQKLYKLYKEAPLEGFDVEFQKIDERFATIEVYNDQIREIKGVRMCPNCHTEVSMHERYCSACGQKLPEIIHIQTDEKGNTVIEGPNAEVIDFPEEAEEKENTETRPEPEETEEAESEPEETGEKIEEAGSEPEETEKEAEEEKAAEGSEPEGTEEETEEVGSEPEKTEEEAEEEKAAEGSEPEGTGKETEEAGSEAEETEKAGPEPEELRNPEQK